MVGNLVRSRREPAGASVTGSKRRSGGNLGSSYPANRRYHFLGREMLTYGRPNSVIRVGQRMFSSGHGLLDEESSNKDSTIRVTSPGSFLGRYSCCGGGELPLHLMGENVVILGTTEGCNCSSTSAQGQR